MSSDVAQSYWERLPTPALASHVSAVWVQGVSADAPAYTHRTVPNGSVELSAEIGSAPVVTGPQSGPIVTTLAPGTDVVGVRFRPGAAAAILGVPAANLLDLRVPLEQVWGRTARRVEERLAEAGSPDRATGVLESEVLARSSDPRALDALVAEVVRLLQPRTTRGVSDLGSVLWISERQLRRRVYAGLGYGPKTLHRILRFQRFLALVHARNGNGSDLADLAAEAGFADQAHLTRESNRLSGLTPRALVSGIEEQCGPTHDHAASFLPLLRGRDADHTRRSA
jgi:AraC-like DNA-binding protein